MAGPKIDFSHLTPAERLDLIGELWDSLDQDAPFELSPEVEAELDRRVGELQSNPALGRSWEEVRADLLRRLQ